eukprot:GILK01007151.1.p1 GENE.GILK01007151.1~~GILK01007151.1.p1  ORF type:complete len:596 (+),score=106.79 GILK01007151.1:72-1859(+)
MMLRRTASVLGLSNRGCCRLLHSTSSLLHRGPLEQKLKDGPSLQDFISGTARNKSTDLKHEDNESVVSVPRAPSTGSSYFVETYGCQMNISDTEIVSSIMQGAGYQPAQTAEEAKVVFLNTCAIRDNAEQKVWHRLYEIKHTNKKLPAQDRRVVGVLGCMAERLKDKLLESEQLVQLVAGPDAYRDLPTLLHAVQGGEQAINVQLSVDETYADVAPVRPSANSISAFVSIMRGCNNMCSYCIVPFTRGRERSRPAKSIVDEIKVLRDQGFKEVMLLGQNVNSYHDGTDEGTSSYQLAKGFRDMYKLRSGGGVRFADLLDRVADVDPEMRVRFISPHPKDFTDDVLHVIKERPNICNSLHIPAQSGSTTVLERMRRGYTREAYLELIDRIRNLLPGAGLSTDFISGFCGETEEEHQDTISLMNQVIYDQAFMFAYSLREKTHAHRTMTDDVLPEVKSRRLQEVMSTFHSNLASKLAGDVGQLHLVLVDKISRKSADELSGRSDTNRKCVFANVPVRNGLGLDGETVQMKPGDYVLVRVDSIASQTYRCTPVARTTIQEWSSASIQDRRARVGSEIESILGSVASPISHSFRASNAS